ncbi:MAG: hypothetical protein J0665_14290 [Deltaproteobacteria bacterium]|jgi:hypothetical protein|nr:hypothetical protein [Deltaproteobacteria bacterium]
MIKTVCRVLVFALLLLTVAMLAGCGDSSSSGQGNTVYLSASGKGGSTFSIYTDLVDITTSSYNSGSLDYTIISTIYTGTTSIAASNVIIKEAQISYKPLIATDDSIPPVIPSWTKQITGLLAPEGSLDLTMTVVDDLAMTYFDKNAPAVKLPNVEYRYEISVVFIGTEVNTGKSITCPAVVTNLYITNNASLI